MKTRYMIMWIAVAMVAGCSVDKEEGLYYSEEMECSFVPPEEWAPRSMGQGVAFARPIVQGETFAENVSVIKQEIPAEISLDAYVNAGIEGLEKVFADFILASRTNTTINGIPACEIIYWATIDNLKVKNLIYLLITDGKSYVITCTMQPETFDTYRKTMETAARTFRVE